MNWKIDLNQYPSQFTATMANMLHTSQWQGQIIWRHSWVPGQFSFKYKIAYSTLVKNMNTRGQLVLKTGMETGRYVTVNASFCNLRQ